VKHEAVACKDGAHHVLSDLVDDIDKSCVMRLSMV
jgi:hypothetical protein